MSVPSRPKIYHIVHVDNLASIIAQAGLQADALMLNRPGVTVIGMSDIKQRRLRLPINCHQGLAVGGCVPFYLCPRSIMLYVIYRANHSDLTYRGGQGPIIHLECDMQQAAQWAEWNNLRWAFSLSNAGAYYTQFRARWDQLGELDWDAIAATDFRDPDTKEGKQAEFLVENSFPWELVERIGLCSADIAPRVAIAMQGSTHRPRVEVLRPWYY